MSKDNEASKPACAHRIVDARNEIVKSGYLCVDCGAVFAGIHAPAASSVEQDERGAFEAWARDEGMDLERGIIGAGAYNDSSTQACWRGWKHRARAASIFANVAQPMGTQLFQHLLHARSELGRTISDPMWADHAEVSKAALKRWHSAIDTAIKAGTDGGECRSCVDGKCVTGDECVTLGRDGGDAT